MTPALSADPQRRLERAHLSLNGLSVGDAFGERFFQTGAEQLIQDRELPGRRWFWTDDTAMACGIVEVLAARAAIDQSMLAQVFARTYASDPGRGYGATAHGILRSIGSGIPWRMASGSVFDGQGSMGNGSAMRVAPLGAYFADDMTRVVDQARLSAEVTHLNNEGLAGAIAVAVAAACAARSESNLLGTAIELTPDSETREGLRKAKALTSIASVPSAIFALGNGSKVCCPDTVPFALWCAQRHLNDFEEALWMTVSGLGDRDTNCAIVGGIVSLQSAIPPSWLALREALPAI